MRRLFLRQVARCLLAVGLASSLNAYAQKTEMLLYCGITMVRPMTEIAHAFEQTNPVSIRIAQGGSEDLFQSAKKSGKGDWYLPGEPSYLERHQAEGLFGNHATVGYNQLALVVQKGNPKKVKADARELLRKDLSVIIGNSESGSVGQEAKTVLDRLGIYPQVVKASAYLSPDSRSLMNAMKRGDADATLSWRATAAFPDNASKLDALALDAKIAKPQALLLIALKSSQNPALAQSFMQFAAGEAGQAIFRRYGFLDNKTHP